MSYTLQARLVFSWSRLLLPAEAALAFRYTRPLCDRLLAHPGGAESLRQIYRGLAMAQ